MAARRLILAHFRRLKYAVSAMRGTALLDIDTFQATVRMGTREFVLHPRFRMSETESGRPRFGDVFNADAVVFGGWRPYAEQKVLALADKLLIVGWLAKAGISTPMHSIHPSANLQDVLVKKRIASSAGLVRGPFQHSDEHKLASGEYYERFIRGKSLRIWYWNDVPACIEMGDMPSVTGDGKHSIAELAQAKAAYRQFRGQLDRIDDVIAYQGMTRASVPAAGASVLIDLRCNSRFAGRDHVSDVDLETEEDMPGLSEFESVGRAIWRELSNDSNGGLLYTVDAIWDINGKLWFVDVDLPEMVHPYVYAPMLRELATAPSRPLRLIPTV